MFGNHVRGLIPILEGEDVTVVPPLSLFCLLAGICRLKFHLKRCTISLASMVLSDRSDCEFLAVVLLSVQM